MPKALDKSLDRLREAISNFGRSRFSLLWKVAWGSAWNGAKTTRRLRWRPSLSGHGKFNEGVLFLPGVHRKREHLDCYHLRLHVHNGLLGTFFQFPRTIKKEKDPERKVVRFDEEKTFSVSYRRIASDAKLPQHNAVPQ